MIEASSRKISFSSLWSNAEALQDRVAQSATNSRAAQWELKGTRACDPWPVVFDYQTRENLWAPRIWLKLFVVFVVYLVVQPALGLNSIALSIGWTATLVTAGFYLLFVGAVSLIFLPFWVQYRASDRRKQERITVDLDGIMFDDGVRRLEAAWAEVTGYEVAHGPGIMTHSVVKTQHGDFDFLPNLKEAGLLRAVIQRYADQSATHEWRLPTDADALGGEAARWTGGKAGVGTRFYHYRTRTRRILLLGVTFSCFTGLLVIVSVICGWLPGTPPPMAESVAIGVGGGMALLLGLRAYLRNGIAVDDTGLTRRMIFSSQFLAWEQIQNFVFSQTSGGKVAGRTQTLKFGSDIAGSEELTAEIKRRIERTKIASLMS